ncbi:MAG: lytic transglycosylase domain-containing protein [Verrucomicrobiota bacterium]
MRTVSRSTALKIIYWNVALAVTIVCMAGVSFIRRIHRYDDLIVRISRERGLDPRLVSSLIWRESRFEADRVGTHKEVGLMQVTETAGQEWAKASGVIGFSRDTLFNPATNIQAGTWYLARAIRRWSDRPDPLPFALAEYNAGRSNAQRWSAASGPNSRRFWETIDYPTTKRYIRDILRRYRGGV